MAEASVASLRFYSHRVGTDHSHRRNPHIRRYIISAMPADISLELAELIGQATRRKPYVFVVMPFGSKSWLFERIARTVDQCAGLSCIRADDIPGAGFDLLNKIHAAIERSDLTIAEISVSNANVFYEVGYAAGI